MTTKYHNNCKLKRLSLMLADKMYRHIQRAIYSVLLSHGHSVKLELNDSTGLQRQSQGQLHVIPLKYHNTC